MSLYDSTKGAFVSSARAAIELDLTEANNAFSTLLAERAALAGRIASYDDRIAAAQKLVDDFIAALGSLK